MSEIAHTLTELPGLRARGVETIVWGGLTAGTLDILDAFIVSGRRGVGPTRVLRYIASGLLGPMASQDGTAPVALGLGLHFVIAVGAAATYFAATRKFAALLRHPILSGMLFGLGVWAFMQFVVVPLSLARQGGLPTFPMLINQLAIHALGVGVPIAWFASRSARRAKES